jgi:hypothetical protein
VGAAGGERDGDPDPEPAVPARAGQQRPAEAARPLGQSGQAGSGGPAGGRGLAGPAAGGGGAGGGGAVPGRRPGAVVGQLGAGAGTGHRDGDPGIPGAGVAHDVGAALPDRPRQQGVHLRWQVIRARRVHPAVDAGRGQGPAGGGELGGQARLPVAGHRLPHLREGAAGDRFQLGDLLRRPLRVRFERPSGQLALERDQRQAVAEQVVQVARDPQPLLRDRHPGQLGAGLLQRIDQHVAPFRAVGEEAAQQRHRGRRQQGAVIEAVPHADRQSHGRARRHPDGRPGPDGREPAGRRRGHGQCDQPVHLPHHEQGRAEHDDHPHRGHIPHGMKAQLGAADQHPPVEQHHEDRGAGHQEGRVPAEALLAEQRHGRQGQEDRDQHPDDHAPDPQHAGHAAVQVVAGRLIGAVGGHTTHHASTGRGGHDLTLRAQAGGGMSRASRSGNDICHGRRCGLGHGEAAPGHAEHGAVW